MITKLLKTRYLLTGGNVQISAKKKLKLSAFNILILPMEEKQMKYVHVYKFEKDIQH